MDYLKTFENFTDLGFEVEPPDPGLTIVYDHPKVNEILKFLEKNLGTKENPLTEFTSDRYPDSKFYGFSKDHIMFEHDPKNDALWVRYVGFWTVFNSKFNLNYDEVKEVMSWYIGTTYNLKATNTSVYYQRPGYGRLLAPSLRRSRRL